jgi:hypothetical protein
MYAWCIYFPEEPGAVGEVVIYGDTIHGSPVTDEVQWTFMYIYVALMLN